jgi:hypothetical protein
VWCHTSEFMRDLLQSGIHKMLRVHHFGYLPCVFLDTGAFVGQT